MQQSLGKILMVTQMKVGIFNKPYQEKKRWQYFTKWPAYAIFKEDKLGTLEIGKLADITIFDQDIMTIPNEDILATKVVMTVVGGKIVYING